MADIEVGQRGNAVGPAKGAVSDLERDDAREFFLFASLRVFFLASLAIRLAVRRFSRTSCVLVLLMDTYIHIYIPKYIFIYEEYP